MPNAEPLTVTWKRPEDELPEDGQYVFVAERENIEEEPEINIAYFEYTDNDGKNKPYFFMDLVHNEPIDALAWTPVPKFDQKQLERVTYKALRAQERAEASTEKEKGN